MAQVITGSAVLGIRGILIKNGISLYLKTGMFLTRGMTIRKYLAIATEFTGKQYPKSKGGLALALEDLEALCAVKNLSELGETRQVNQAVGGVAADL